jgi:hypothetical protein
MMVERMTIIRYRLVNSTAESRNNQIKWNLAKAATHCNMLRPRFMSGKRSGLRKNAVIIASTRAAKSSRTMRFASANAVCSASEFHPVSRLRLFQADDG